MKQRVFDSVLPLVGVSGAVVALTLALFDVPSSPPPARYVAAPAPTCATTSDATEPTATPRTRSRDQLDDTLGRALRILEAARTTSAAPAAAPSPSGAGIVGAPGIPTPLKEQGSAAGPDPQAMLQSVTTLSQAIKAAREARTEADLVNAEEQLRAARQQMEATCGAPGSPLCDSAQTIRSLGF